MKTDSLAFFEEFGEVLDLFDSWFGSGIEVAGAFADVGDGFFW
jgi:hypothetical protein